MPVKRLPLFAALGLFSVIVRAAGSAAAPTELVPQQVLPVEGPGRFQPSGLAVVGGELFTVSDKHDDAVFRLVLQPERAVAERALTIDRGDDDGWLDLEGLVPDGAGGFYVVSEERSRVLQVPAAGRARWVTADLKPAARVVGLLVEQNAGFEGLTLLAPGRFLLAAERSPRGLIELDLNAPSPSLHAVKWDETRFASPAGRVPDFADLAVWRGRVFGLLRGAGVVCELVRDPGAPSGWREGDGVSFAKLEEDPRTRYRDLKYGIVEGLALDDAHLFLVHDNNDDALAADAKDHRPRLVVFANPFGRRP